MSKKRYHMFEISNHLDVNEYWVQGTTLVAPPEFTSLKEVEYLKWQGYLDSDMTLQELDIPDENDLYSKIQSIIDYNKTRIVTGTKYFDGVR